jgi:hypothetical protein
MPFVKSIDEGHGGAWRATKRDRAQPSMTNERVSGGLCCGGYSLFASGHP